MKIIYLFKLLLFIKILFENKIYKIIYKISQEKAAGKGVAAASSSSMVKRGIVARRDNPAKAWQASIKS